MVHKPGEFTGEAAQLTGHPAVVTAVAQTDCEVYPVSPEALRDAPEPVSGPGRHHPPGVHRKAAAAPRIGKFHRPACDRLALLARHVSGARFPGQEPDLVHLAGLGHFS